MIVVVRCEDIVIGGRGVIGGGRFSGFSEWKGVRVCDSGV